MSVHECFAGSYASSSGAAACCCCCCCCCCGGGGGGGGGGGVDDGGGGGGSERTDWRTDSGSWGASAPVATATIATAPALLLKDDPMYSKYFKMLRLGVPTPQIRHKMAMVAAEEG